VFYFLQVWFLMLFHLVLLFLLFCCSRFSFGFEFIFRNINIHIHIQGDFAGTPDLVEAMALHSPALQSLGLANCFKTTDASVTRLLSAGVGAHLLSLNLFRNTLLTDVSVVAIAASCRLLRALDISHCVKMSGKGVFALVRRCRDLRRLAIAGFSIAAVPDAVVAAIEQWSPALVLERGEKEDKRQRDKMYAFLASTRRETRPVFDSTI
jgi:hypothetical protein